MDPVLSIWSPLRQSRGGLVFRNLKEHPFTKENKVEICESIQRYELLFKEYYRDPESNRLNGVTFPKSDLEGIQQISLNAASNRYKIPRRTLRGWYSKW